MVICAEKNKNITIVRNFSFIYINLIFGLEQVGGFMIRPYLQIKIFDIIYLTREFCPNRKGSDLQFKLITRPRCRATAENSINQKS